MGATFNKFTEPGISLEKDEYPSFDPHLGFEQPRKKIEMKVSDKVLLDAQIPHEVHDYCSHKLIPLLRCRRDNFPFMGKCEKLEHPYLDCQYDMTVLRAKEFERERRLRLRQRRIDSATAKENRADHG